MLLALRHWFEDHRVSPQKTPRGLLWEAVVDGVVPLRFGYDPLSPEDPGGLEARLVPIPFEARRREKLLEVLLTYNRSLVAKQGYGIRGNVEFFCLEARLTQDTPQASLEVWLTGFLNHAHHLRRCLTPQRPPDPSFPLQPL